MSNTNVEVKKNANENALSLVRRFQKRVQESGVLPRVRGIRYNVRPLSELKSKRAKLKKLGNLATEPQAAWQPDKTASQYQVSFCPMPFTVARQPYRHSASAGRRYVGPGVQELNS